MSHGNEQTPRFPGKQHDDLLIGSACVVQERAMSSLAADRLYQVAAVTAGIFLLATLL
jgi:hypothetical protein